MNDNTVTTNPPIKVTAHNGIDSKKPHDSIASIIACGRVEFDELVIFAVVIIFETMPCDILNIDNIKSIPYVTTILAIANVNVNIKVVLPQII